MRQVFDRAISGGFGRHFLAVQGNRHAVGRGTGALYQSNGFAHCRARAHHVIHDQHLSFERRTHQRAALAMVFGFFAVVGKRVVVAQARQLYGDCRAQWNAFVGRAENHVKLQTGRHQGLRVKPGQAAELHAVIEQTGVKKIGRLASCLGFEAAEFEYPRFQRELNERLRQRVVWRMVQRHGGIPCSNSPAST